MMRRSSWLIVGGAVALVAVNLFIYFFVYAPSMQNAHELIEEVRAVPAWLVEVSVEQAAPTDAFTEEVTEAGDAAVYAWPINDGGLAGSETEADSYLVARLVPSEASATVLRTRAVRDVESSIAFIPETVVQLYLLKTSSMGFATHLMLPVTSPVSHDVRMMSPLLQDNNTQNTMLDYQARLVNGSWHYKSYIVSNNESRVQELTGALNAHSKALGEQESAGGFTGFVGAQEKFFSIQAS